MNGFTDLSQYMAAGHSYLWRPEILWLHFISDFVMAACYLSLPLVMLYFVRKRPESFPQRWTFYMLSVFMVFCGLGHIASIMTIWHPIYFWQGLLKAATASLSFSIAILLLPLLPHLMGSLGERKK